MPQALPSAILSSDPAKLLKTVLASALRLTVVGIDEMKSNPIRPAAEITSIEVRGAWMRALRKAFAKHCRDASAPDRIYVWGGTPGYDEKKKQGSPDGIKEWKRWEFMYDVAVVKAILIDAAYAKDGPEPKQLPIVERAIWLVESEISENGTEVAIDSSKLRIGRSDHKLFIAKRTNQHDPQKWLEFLGKALQDIDGDVFLALIPSYASRSRGATDWPNGNVELLLYRCAADGTCPREIARVSQASPDTTSGDLQLSGIGLPNRRGDLIRG